MPGLIGQGHNFSNRGQCKLKLHHGLTFHYNAQSAGIQFYSIFTEAFHMKYHSITVKVTLFHCYGQAPPRLKLHLNQLHILKGMHENIFSPFWGLKCHSFQQCPLDSCFMFLSLIFTQDPQFSIDIKSLHKDTLYCISLKRAFLVCFGFMGQVKMIVMLQSFKVFVKVP